MPIQFAPTPKTLVLCDFSLGGFRAPEMIKRRPAIIISPRLPHRDGLCTVVPISYTPPIREVAYVVRLDFERQPLPSPFDAPVAWVKCDMLATVCYDRLDLFRTGRDAQGKRKYLQLKLSDTDFERVRQGIMCALGWG